MMQFANLGTTQEVMMLPKTKVRTVCGPKGIKIKMIRDTSGARIDIDNDCLPGSDSQLCKIAGTPDQCAVAMGLINSALNGEIPADLQGWGGQSIGPMGQLGGPLSSAGPLASCGPLAASPGMKEKKGTTPTAALIACACGVHHFPTHTVQDHQA